MFDLSRLWFWCCLMNFSYFAEIFLPEFLEVHSLLYLKYWSIQFKMFSVDVHNNECLKGHTIHLVSLLSFYMLLSTVLVKVPHPYPYRCHFRLLFAQFSYLICSWSCSSWFLMFLTSFTLLVIRFFSESNKLTKTQN